MRSGYAKIGHALRCWLTVIVFGFFLVISGPVSSRAATAPPPMRIVQIDLDYAYDPDPDQQASNVEALIQHVKALKVNAVFLQAFADTTGTGVAHQVYFPNRMLPVRTDLFGNVVKQLHARTQAKVYAWMPIIAFDFGRSVAHVLAWNPKTGVSAADPNSYARVSPFDPVATQKILNVYEDLARAAPIDGLLFSDDGQLSDFEDSGPLALATYQRSGLTAVIKTIRGNSRLLQQWTTLKTEALITLTQTLTARVKQIRFPLLTVRNIYASPVLDPVSEQWFAQKFSRFLTAYDYTAIEAMPVMEGVPAGQSQKWLQNLVATVATQPQGLQRTIFELQSVDWSKNDAPIPAATLDQQMRLLAGLKALNYGYYPDNFYDDQPKASVISKDMVVTP